MTPIPLSKTKLETKLAVTRAALVELEEMAKVSKEEFLDDDRNFAVAEHHLRRALEAVFDIAGHILSRFPYSPGSRPDTFKRLAVALGDKKIVTKKFAKEQLFKMAGYRNRLVHFYDEVTPSELYGIITHQLKDIEQFGLRIAQLLKQPKKFGLTIEE